MRKRRTRDRLPPVQELERLATIAELGRTVAHEVGNALTAALSLAQVGRLRPGEDTTASLFVTIETEVARAITLLDRFVAAMDRRQAGETETRPVEVGALTRSVGELIGHHLRHASVALDVDAPAVGSVRGRDDELRQVLFNLLFNARDAAGVGGRVMMTAARAGSSIEVRIADSGTGVPAALRERVFDRDFTTKRTGTGRGLAVSREIARDHGGDIAIEDGPLGGAAVVVRLPALD